MYQNLNPPPFKDPVDQGSRGDLMPTWHAWFSQLFKWLQSLGNSVQSLGNSVSNLVSNYNTAVVWDGVNDRVLGIGQHTSDSFTSATSIPLHIACGDGQVYELTMDGTFTPAASGAHTILQSNNTTPATNSFNMTFSGIYGTSSTVDNSYGPTLADGGFRLGQACPPYVLKATVYTSTLYKNCMSDMKGYETTYGARFYRIVSLHNDTTTLWNSLGTITMSSTWTGQIVCRRVA